MSEAKLLSGEHLERLSAALDKARAEVHERLQRRRLALRSSDSGGRDEMDQALASTNLELTARLMDRDAKLLGEIDHARSKLRDGRYGFCERSGEPIGFERLLIRPWTRFAGAAKEVVDREKRDARAAGVTTGLPRGEAA